MDDNELIEMVENLEGRIDYLEDKLSKVTDALNELVQQIRMRSKLY